MSNKKNSLYKTIVIKVGSAVLSQDGKIALKRLHALVELLVTLQKQYQVILVSSGAVAAGYTLIKLDKKEIENKQVLAALGQPLLMKMYKKVLNKYGIFCAQVLLEATVFEDKKRLTHMKNSIGVMLKNNIIPIINENDVTAIQELVFGDNDQLSAHLTYHIDADLLVILTDIDGYYDDNPHLNKNAKMIKSVNYIDENDLNVQSTSHNEFATGGIVTKLKAANFLMQKNKKMFLTSGFDLKYIYEYLIQNIHNKGTLFEVCNE